MYDEILTISKNYLTSIPWNYSTVSIIFKIIDWFSINPIIIKSM